MPNIIPPIVSSSPPPLDPVEDDDNDNDDEGGDDFGDFTTANFEPSGDTTVSKTITDTSWALPHSEEPFDQPSRLCDNGIVSHEESFSKTYHKNVPQMIDNTSHDTVMSEVSDLPNHQDSNSTPPINHFELSRDCNDSLLSYQLSQNGEFQLQSDMTVADEPASSTLESNQISSVSCGMEEPKEEISKLSRVPATSSFSAEAVADQGTSGAFEEISSNKRIDLSHEDDGKGQMIECEPVPAIPNECQNGEGISDVGHTVDNCEFGDWSKCSLSDKINASDSEKQCKDNHENSECITSNHIDKCEEPEISRSPSRSPENEWIRAMIIPEVPGLDDDDEFGDFGEIVSTEKSRTHSLSTGEPDELLSPSRRPTLVLSEDLCEVPSLSSQLPSDADTENDPSNPLREGCSTEDNNSSCPMTLEKNENPASSSTADFDNEFADFTQAQVSNPEPVLDQWAQAAQVHVGAVESSDFDDFDDFESAEFQSADAICKSDPSPSSYFDLQSIQASLGQVLKENFPLPGDKSFMSDMDACGTGGLSGIVLDVEESSIWQGLRDLESTPSLSFQWPGSHSNRGLLGALNIDSRNILFGPKWNTVVPRFAANLGFSPLEPVRAVPSQPSVEPSPRCEIIQPQIVENIKPSSDQAFQEVVPAAQFDWSDSGLINPLDSNKDPSSSPLATTAASGNPVLTTTPIQVEQLLANSKRSTPLSPLEKNRDPTLSPEAVKVLDTLPELAFLSARMLMFPMQNNENKL